VTIALCEYIKAFEPCNNQEIKLKAKKRKRCGFLQTFIAASNLNSGYKCLQDSATCCIDSKKQFQILKELNLKKDTDILKYIQAYYISDRKDIDPIDAENLSFALLSCHFSAKISLVLEQNVKRLSIRCFKPPGVYKSETVIVCSRYKCFQAVLQAPNFKDRGFCSTDDASKIKRRRTTDIDLNPTVSVSSSLHGYSQYKQSNGNLAMPFFETFLFQCEASINDIYVLRYYKT
jgi:hypothetical protein